MRELSRRLPIRGRGYSLAYKACGPLMCNVYTLICEATRDAVIIDPSPHDNQEMQILQSYLEDRNATPRHILLTHGHADHVAGVSEAMKIWPNVGLHLHPFEAENYALAEEMGRNFGIEIETPLPTPTDTLSDGEFLKVGNSIELQVIHTPGHSPGHVAFVDNRANINIECNNNNFSDNSRKNENYSGRGGAVIIGGDLLFRGSVGRTDFFNSSTEDLFGSLRRLYEEFDEESIVLSGHTTPTFLREERKKNSHVMSALLRSDEWFQEAKKCHNWKDTSSSSVSTS